MRTTGIVCGIVFCLTFLAAGSAHASDLPAECCAEDETPIFSGESEGTLASICIPEQNPGESGKLTFCLVRMDGTLVQVSGDVVLDPSFAVGDAASLSGGGYAYIRVRDGDKAYVAYTGIGKFMEGVDEPVTVAGVAIEVGGRVTEVLDMTESNFSILGPEIFQEMNLPRDTAGFDLPLGAPMDSADDGDAAFAVLARALAQRMSETNRRGGRSAIVVDGMGNVDGKRCRLFMFGENTPEKFTALDHYAVSPEGKIYRMDILQEGKYVPVDAE